MALAITLARLSRRIYLVARLHRLGYVTEKYIDEEGLGRRRTGTRQAPGQSFTQNSDRFLAKNLNKKAFSQNGKSGWPVAPLSHLIFVVMPGRKDSPLPVRRLMRWLQARNTSHGLSCHFEYEAGPEQNQAWQSSNGLHREHTSLAERLFP